MFADEVEEQSKLKREKLREIEEESKFKREKLRVFQQSAQAAADRLFVDPVRVRVERKPPEGSVKRIPTTPPEAFTRCCKCARVSSASSSSSCEAV